MNYNERNRHDRDYGGYQTHRSERYRHPEQYSESFRSDDYRSLDRDRDNDRISYSNEFYRSSQRRSPQDWDSQHVANRGLTTYDTSRNYGNMGSYGGAQGFGSERGGFSHYRGSDTGSAFESGMGDRRYSDRGRGQVSSQGRRYGYQSDYDSHGQSSDNYRYEQGGNRDLYGDYTSRRFQGSDQGRYNFDRDDYSTRSFGGDRGNYMGSGYERSPRRTEFGATRGDYGSSGQYMGRTGSSSYDEPYGMSGYYRGGYGDSDYNSYARDRDERNNDW